MERIGTATLSRRANGQTSSGSFVTRKLQNLCGRKRQMNVDKLRVHPPAKRHRGTRLTGLTVNAASADCQARIVKAIQEKRWGKVKPCNGS